MEDEWLLATRRTQAVLILMLLIPYGGVVLP